MRFLTKFTSKKEENGRRINLWPLENGFLIIGKRAFFSNLAYFSCIKEKTAITWKKGADKLKIESSDHLFAKLKVLILHALPMVLRYAVAGFGICRQIRNICIRNFSSTTYWVGGKITTIINIKKLERKQSFECPSLQVMLRCEFFCDKEFLHLNDFCCTTLSLHNVCGQQSFLLWPSTLATTPQPTSKTKEHKHWQCQ